MMFGKWHRLQSNCLWFRNLIVITWNFNMNLSGVTSATAFLENLEGAINSDFGADDVSLDPEKKPNIWMNLREKFLLWNCPEGWFEERLPYFWNPLWILLLRVPNQQLCCHCWKVGGNSENWLEHWGEDLSVEAHEARLNRPSWGNHFGLKLPSSNSEDFIERAPSSIC